MKKRKITLRGRTFRTLLLFAVVTLLAATLLQTVFLDDFYAQIKRRNLSSALSSIVSSATSDDRALQQLVEDAASYYNVCLLVTDGEMNCLASAEGTANCSLHKLRKSDLLQLYAAALAAGGSYSCEAHLIMPERPDDPFGGESPHFPGGFERDRVDSIIKLTVVTSDSGAVTVLYANAVITPFSDTVNAIRAQLLVILLVMLLLAIVLSIGLSRRITSPIEQMNDEAAKLAKGDLTARFSENTGSLELDELGEKLNYAASELSKVDKLRSELIANVSHDLRTPLTLITGYSEMMRDLPGENTPENLELVIAETKRLTALVNDVLDVSKYRSGSFALSPQRFCLTADVRSTIARISKLAEPQGFTLRFDANEELCVEADRAALSRVLYNLIGNALNYSGDSRLVELRQRAENGFARIDVIDHGKGIAAEELPRVFDRYYRSSEAHTRAIVGSGLGLSIVKSILEAHGADFGVDSALGQGSDFWFTLKLANGDAVPNGADKAAPEKHGARHSGSSR